MTLGEKNEKTLWEKIDDAPSWLFFIIPFIVISIPIIHPIGTPISISEYGQNYFDILESLPDGSVVVFQNGAIEMHWDMFGPSIVTTYKYLWSRNFKVICYCYNPQGIAVPYIKALRASDPEGFGKVYGEDYAVFGVVGGFEVGMASFAADMRATYAEDYYGNSIDSLPVMKGINSGNDIDLVVSSQSGCDEADWLARQWAEAYDVRVISVMSWGCIPLALPYYPAQINGILPDVEGGAEIEIMTGFLGTAAAYVDAKSIGGFLILGVFLLAQVVMIGLKATAGERRRDRGQSVRG